MEVLVYLEDGDLCLERIGEKPFFWDSDKVYISKWRYKSLINPKKVSEEPQKMELVLREVK